VIRGVVESVTDTITCDREISALAEYFDVTDRYAEHLKEDLKWRRDVSERTGLGFALTTLDSPSGQLGQPEDTKLGVETAAQ